MPYVTPTGWVAIAPENWLMATWPRGQALGTGGGAHMPVDGFRHRDAPLRETDAALAHMDTVAWPCADSGCMAYERAPTEMVSNDWAGVSGFKLIMEGE